jgi:hypothetical protein
MKLIGIKSIKYRILYTNNISQIYRLYITKNQKNLQITKYISKYNKESRFNINILIITKNISRIRYINSLRI